MWLRVQGAETAVGARPEMGVPVAVLGHLPGHLPDALGRGPLPPPLIAPGEAKAPAPRADPPPGQERRGEAEGPDQRPPRRADGRRAVGLGPDRAESGRARTVKGQGAAARRLRAAAPAP